VHASAYFSGPEYSFLINRLIAGSRLSLTESLTLGGICMLTEAQLREIGAAVEEALQTSLSEPNGLLSRLLEMASTEVYQQIKAYSATERRAAA
jgi:hypothetical protein